MNDGLYQFIVNVLGLLLWDGELVGEENLPRGGPAVFIANHLEALGPIAADCSIPLRLYAWTVADMVDEEKAAAWLKWDFVERTLELKPPLSAWVAKGLSKITVPFLRSLGCIPVYKGEYDRMADTLRLSMDVLRQGKFLLVFPEDNHAARGPGDGNETIPAQLCPPGGKVFRRDRRAAGILSGGDPPIRLCDGREGCDL